MELFLLLLFIAALPLCFAFRFLLDQKITRPPRTSGRTPPGPPAFPMLGNLFVTTSSQLAHALGRLKAAYGPIFTVYVGRRPAVFITNRTLAHLSLVRQGAALAHRPVPPLTDHALSANVDTINTAPYGPRWRHLRRALSSGVFHPSQLSLQADARAWAFDALVGELESRAAGAGGGAVQPGECFQFFSFRLFTLLCFGERFGEEMVRAIWEAQMGFLQLVVVPKVYHLVPGGLLVMLLGRWNKLLRSRRRLRDLFVPIIRERRRQRRERGGQGKVQPAASYLDGLLDLHDRGEEKLTEEEMVSLCSELLSASAETSFVALEWIMANLVIHQDVQEKLSGEIAGVMTGGAREARVEEEDIRRMPYLRAVVLEGLRRHPPVQILLPHTVVEDTVLDGRYVISRGAIVNCLVAEIGRDAEVWAEPMKFRPERFMAGGEGEGVDLMGQTEIKMMPFGAGRRMCPGMAVSVLLLEFAVANLVSRFRWERVAGEEVNLEEEPGLAVGMKNPLRARIAPRYL